jgi:chromate transporter
VFGDLAAVAGILGGIKPAVTAIVGFAAYRIGSRVLTNAALWLLAASAFAAIFLFKVPFPYIVLAAALIGALGGRLAPRWFRSQGHSGSKRKDYGSALIGDDTPLPAHARFRWTRIVSVAISGAAIWVAVESVLYAAWGWHGVLTQMGWFFTKAALLTFGGAYAVLPYVYQGGVEHYGWLSAPQMIDGLALGETTPGPLIMVVAFVGFVGGWTHAALGSATHALAGAAGATVATIFTFLPSFVFILAGAPLVEATRHDLKFAAPLTAVTAAVVGVIINLAVFFAWHVLWPQASGAAPFSGSFGWFPLVIGIAAFLALWRYKVGIIPVILACGGVGLARALVGTL